MANIVCMYYIFKLSTHTSLHCCTRISVVKLNRNLNSFNTALTPYISCFENSVDSDQLASENPAAHDPHCFAITLINTSLYLEFERDRVEALYIKISKTLNRNYYSASQE